MPSPLRSVPSWRTRFPVELCLAAAVLLLWLSPVSAQDALVEGRDYTRIAQAQTWQPDDGRIEVVEVFAYACPHCAQLDSHFEAWAAALPADVRFERVPIRIGRDAEANTVRAYFAARQLGVLAITHTATFAAIHDEHLLPAANPSLDEIVGFYASLGVDADAVRAAMRSEAVAQEVRRALEFVTHAQVRSTPALVVNGRYVVLGQSIEQVFAHANALIERERTARAP